MSDRPYVSFQEVKAKVSIPDVLAKLDLLDQFTEKHGVYTGVCPLPTHKHGPQPNDQQFKINQKGDLWLWHCFGDCDRGGDVIELVKLVNELSDAHVRFWFADNFSDRLQLTKQGTASDEKETEPTPHSAEQAVAVADDATQPPLKPLRFYLDLDANVPYLVDRGVQSETIERYGLGLCSKGVLNGYVAIPVYRWPKESDGENPCGYIGRWPGDDWNDTDRPRYMIPSGFEVSRVVYGLEQALSESDEQSPLLVVEGPFKVYHLVQHGFPNCVSTFTSSLSEEHADILIGTGRPIVLLFDGNEAGQQGMRKAAAKLITQTYVRVVKLEQDVEPDELNQSQLDELLGFAKPSK